MEYISVSEASKKWGVSLRQVQRLLAVGRIPSAHKYGRSWMIPRDAEKPPDPRWETAPPQKSLPAELALATAAVSVIAPEMAPDWLKDGDFSALSKPARLNAVYLRVKYFQCTGQHEAMLASVQTALTLGALEQGLTQTDIYLRVTCAVACYALGHVEDAKSRLLEAMRVCLPHGFITPFAEVVTVFGGLIEACLEQYYPDYRDAVLEQWKRTWKNWVTYHNQFTKDNITLMLTLREYHITLLASRHVPYAQIAKQYNISVGRLKNIMLEIYGKLFISGRDELSKYVF